MDAKKILFALLVSALLMGSVCAASVNGFNIDNTYKNVYSSDYYSVYANDNQDSGILVFKNVNDDIYDDTVNDDVLDNLIQHDGREYITPDDDLSLNKTSDNIATFIDHDHATHGASEVINVDGEQFIVVSWAKDSSNIDTAKLVSILNDFNTKNNVQAIAF